MEVHGYTGPVQDEEGNPLFPSIDATIDGVRMTVPDNMANRYRQLIAEWEAEGNTIPAYDPPPATVSDYEDAIQAHVDAAARSKLFRDGVTFASYVASTNAQWAAEAQAFVEWRDAVWAYAYQELARVQGGQREQPTVAAIIAELPPINWP